MMPAGFTSDASFGSFLDEIPQLQSNVGCRLDVQSVGPGAVRFANNTVTGSEGGTRFQTQPSWMIKSEADRYASLLEKFLTDSPNPVDDSLTKKNSALTSRGLLRIEGIRNDYKQIGSKFRQLEDSYFGNGSQENFPSIQVEDWNSEKTVQNESLMSVEQLRTGKNNSVLSARLPSEGNSQLRRLADSKDARLSNNVFNASSGLFSDGGGTDVLRANILDTSFASTAFRPCSVASSQETTAIPKNNLSALQSCLESRRDDIKVLIDRANRSNGDHVRQVEKVADKNSSSLASGKSFAGFNHHSNFSKHLPQYLNSDLNQPVKTVSKFSSAATQTTKEKGIQCDYINNVSKELQTSILTEVANGRQRVTDEPCRRHSPTKLTNILQKVVNSSVGKSASTSSDASTCHDEDYYAELRKRLKTLRDGDVESSSVPHNYKNPKAENDHTKQQQAPSDFGVVSLPFVAGQSTGRSYSVSVNLQEMLAFLKLQHPILRQTFLKLCAKRPSLKGQQPDVLDMVALSEAFNVDIKKLSDSLVDDLYNLLKQYDELKETSQDNSQLEKTKLLIEAKNHEWQQLTTWSKKLSHALSVGSDITRERSFSSIRCKKIKESFRKSSATKKRGGVGGRTFADKGHAFAQPTLSSLQRTVSDVPKVSHKSGRNSSVAKTILLRNINQVKQLSS